MIETGLYSVDVWVDFETVDESGHVLAASTDIQDLELFKPGKVVVAFDDDRISLAVVVGRVRQGSETQFRLALAPGDIDEYVEAVVRAVSDPWDELVYGITPLVAAG